jgi:hypothetical protein
MIQPQRLFGAEERRNGVNIQLLENGAVAYTTYPTSGATTSLRTSTRHYTLKAQAYDGLEITKQSPRFG